MVKKCVCNGIGFNEVQLNRDVCGRNVCQERQYALVSGMHSLDDLKASFLIPGQTNFSRKFRAEVLPEGCERPCNKSKACFLNDLGSTRKNLGVVQALHRSFGLLQWFLNPLLLAFQ
ncbi:hypothetical protein ABEB36_002718 [Hypothenemus hampei]|uniref:Uncharacterized protein n=1 Tax=Hypothenemus hampei TaxID=57062 RepID=A0ABD1F6R6_HYPHA